MEGLVKRTHQFSMAVIRLFSQLPRHRVAYVLGDQFLRAGLSPGAHFREGLRARSRAEYVSKLNGGVMELEETRYWLELLVSNEIVTRDDSAPIDMEADELIAIFVSECKKWSPKLNPQEKK
jgi:four helix bundle protein